MEIRIGQVFFVFSVGISWGWVELQLGVAYGFIDFLRT